MLYLGSAKGVAPMTGPQDPATTGRDRLRAARTDREQAIDVLKAAFVHGQLDRDEFGLRIGRALASPTYADLAAVTADITPARPTKARPVQPAREPANKKRKAAAALACATVALLGGVAALPPLPDGSPAALSVIAAIFVLFGVVFTGWFLLLHAWLEERADRQPSRPGPGGRALDGGHGGAGHGPVPPGSSDGQTLRAELRAYQSRQRRRHVRARAGRAPGGVRPAPGAV
jgi:hypothetical protein